MRSHIALETSPRRHDRHAKRPQNHGILDILGSFQANFQRSPTAAMASAHGVLGLVDWLRDLIDTMRLFAHRHDAI